MKGGLQVTGYTVTDVYDTMDAEVWHDIDSYSVDKYGVPFFFPILDMQCEPPQVGGVEMQPIGSSNMRLVWQSSSLARSWQVSYGPAGTLPKEGNVRILSDTTMIITGLEPGKSYVAYLRSQCYLHDGLSWSDWSDSIVVRLPGVEGIGAMGMDNGGLRVSPNPAKGRATVTLPEGGGRLTLTDAAGRLCGSYDVEGTSYELDLGTLSSGIDLLRLSTPQGTASCRLTVQ